MTTVGRTLHLVRPPRRPARVVRFPRSAFEAVGAGLRATRAVGPPRPRLLPALMEKIAELFEPRLICGQASRVSRMEERVVDRGPSLCRHSRIGKDG